MRDAFVGRSERILFGNGAMFERKFATQTGQWIIVRSTRCQYIEVTAEGTAYYPHPTESESLQSAQQRLADLAATGYAETEGSLSWRTYEFGSGEDARFWNVSLEGLSLETHSGKIGTHEFHCYEGRRTWKEHPTRDKALLAYHKAIAEKRAQGYVEQDPRENSYSAPPPEIAAKLKQAAARKSAAAAVEKVDLGKARTFLFGEGKQRKFWRIALDGAKFTVVFGKFGTDGQTQTKTFATAEDARRACEKLVAEKTRKGYVESTAEALVARPGIASAAATPASAAVVTEVTHRIDLDPRDWFWALWRDPDPLPRPEPRPFDKEACLEAIRRIELTKRWPQSMVPPEDALRMTTEEAHFWYMAERVRYEVDTGADVARILSEKTFGGTVSRAEAAEHFRLYGWFVPELLSRLLPAADFVDALLEGPDERGNVFGFVKVELLPYLARTERRALQEVVAKRAAMVSDPGKSRDALPLAWQLAAAVGASDAVERILPRLSDGRFSEVFVYPFALGSAARVTEAHEFLRRERNVAYWSPHLARAWLATHETSRLDVLRDEILGVWKTDGTMLAEALALVKAPEVAVHMLEIRTNRHVSSIASAWLDEQVGNAVAGLIPVAAGRTALAPTALAYLVEKQRAGFGEVIRGILSGCEASVAERVRALLEDAGGKALPTFEAGRVPQWLTDAAQKDRTLQPLAGADFALPKRLAPLVVGDRSLDAAQTADVLVALQHSEFGQVRPLVAAVREKATEKSRNAFAWDVFERWIAAGAPPKHKWAMRTLGLLGTDATALRLAPLVRYWPGESQHARAVLGLDCLRAIGTDAALMQLSGIAQKVKFKALQQRARECVQAIAEEQGLTREQLEDRVVPDCGLDERGRREFDFGPRRFSFALDRDFKPVVRDEDGKLRADLPKPSGKDDAGKAAAALEEWKALKKQLREVLKVQTVRLEQAMVTGRRWTFAEFERLLARHPLTTHLAQRLLWAGTDARGRRACTFRVTEERDYAGSDDEAVDPSGCGSVGIVHPLHLSAEELRTWGERFADYEIVPPFPQLGRQTYVLSTAEGKKSTLERFEGLKIPALQLIGVLTRSNWIRGEPQDAGVFHEHYKHFPSADVTAVIGYDGIPIGYYEGAEDQTLERVAFVEGLYKSRGWPDHERFVKLSDVDGVVVSEVLADLMVLESKAV